MTLPLPPPRTIRLEAPNYIIRSVEQNDASENWCRWLLDPDAVRLLNARPREMTMAELKAYIARFDRVSGHLLGIFERSSGRIVGIRSIYIDHERKEFLDNILIGEADARGKTARSESTDVILPLFFEELDMIASRIAIVGSNQHMLDLVARKGWELVHVEAKPSNNNGPPIELRHFRLTRETWRRKQRERVDARRPV